MSAPTIRTARLVLRPPTLADAPVIAELAGDRRIADTTASVPHPYTVAHAQGFVAWAGSEARRPVWAITRASDATLLGVISLDRTGDVAAAELGYWIGVPHWGQGVATEAAQSVIDDGFATLPLEVVFADHLVRNVASHRVMEKLDLRPEGVRRRRFRKWEGLEDICSHSILRAEWRA